MSSYRVQLERDEDGVWIASVPDVPGCHSYGRSIGQALNRVREALDLFVDDAEEADLVPDLHLPGELRRLADELTVTRELEREIHDRTRATLFTAVAVAQETGLSVRDTAEIVGLSPQRVQQILSDPATTRQMTAEWTTLRVGHARLRAAGRRARAGVTAGSSQLPYRAADELPPEASQAVRAFADVWTDALTAREFEVLRLAVEGMSAGEIAGLLRVQGEGRVIATLRRAASKLVDVENVPAEQ